MKNQTKAESDPTQSGQQNDTGERNAVTPLPWITAGVRDGLHLVRALHTEPGPFGASHSWPVCNAFNKVDAAFIVQACNSHDALLAALEACEAKLGELHGSQFSDCDGACETLKVMAIARAAIARATGASWLVRH